MDTTTVLEKYTQDLSNVPLEVRYLLSEIKYKDTLVAEARKRYQARDNQLHKFIRANGTLAKHPKEEQLYAKIEEDMKLAQKLQKEKIVLANTALFLISKHLHNFENDIAKLENDDLLPPLETGIELNHTVRDDYGLSDSLSRTPTPRNGSSATPVAESIKKGQKRKLTLKGTATHAPPPQEPSPFEGSGGSLALNGDPNGDADNKLYCYCQRVSFGEMVGCDNPTCIIEWFHLPCIGLKNPPKGKWYCDDCKK
ncbi:Chromatin modification-related protein YNG2 [Candida viswanathii]|uniref:Chromatin modification-related protein n=1 Tax=Candida viswanathii TaxID=5486 RepID=A0A367YN71_9ASCO|nr:Chromatin modification-related protein YNG2 [Candida viswanathii]